MNLDMKCKCNHCSESLSFPPEGVGRVIPCPHCGMETVLYQPTAPSKPKTPTNFIADAKNKEEKIASEKAQKIINRLETIGRAFMFVGVICAVVCGIGLLVTLTGNNNYGEEEQTEYAVACVIGVLVSLGQGIIIKTVFDAAAEVIWLLAKLVEKTPIKT